MIYRIRSKQNPEGNLVLDLVNPVKEPLIKSSSRRRGPSNVMPPSYLPPQAGEGDTRLRGNDKILLDQSFLNPVY